MCVLFAYLRENLFCSVCVQESRRTGGAATNAASMAKRCSVEQQCMKDWQSGKGGSARPPYVWCISSDPFQAKTEDRLHRPQDYRPQ